MNAKRFFSRRRHDFDFEQEVRSHIVEETEENVARGFSPEEARRRAYVKFGNPEVVREQLWQQNTFLLLDGVWRDLRYAARSLRRAPGFALTAIFVMALGIGGTVAMFTVVRNILLNPLPYADSRQLYTLYEHENRPNFGPYLPVAGGSFNDWKKAVPEIEMALVSPWQTYNVSSEGGKLPEKIDGAWVSANFFQVLGVQPILGRSFGAEDDRTDATATVILSNGFWQRRYSGDPGIIGRSVWLDAKPYMVIGVLPDSFSYASSMSANTMQVWTPVNHEAWPGLMAQYEDHEFFGVARLSNGMTLPQLLSRLNGVQKQIKASQSSAAVHDGVSGRSMLDDAVEEYKTPLYTLLAATTCVLLIACMNVASLLVARMAAKSRESAIRAAMGGSRLRLLRERLTESFLLSACSGVLGIYLAWLAMRWLVTARHDMHRIETLHLDGGAIAFTVAAVVFSAVFSAFISSLNADRSKILTALQESSRSHSGGAGRATLRRVLLVAEMTLTVVLLVGAGLLLKSYERLRSTDIGVPIDNVLTLTVGLPEARYNGEEKPAAFFEDLLTRVKSLPGVQAAALVSRAPGQGWGGDNLLTVVEHRPLPKGVGHDLQRRAADPGYFAAMQIPILKGRTFNANERLTHAKVTVLSESAVKMLFPDGDDPIGKHVSRGDDEPPYEIVGVVADTRWTITEPIMPMWYMPIFGNKYTYATIIVRSSHDVASLALPVQKVIGQLDPDLPVSGVMTLRETIARSARASRFDSMLVLGFAVIAMVLAAAGLYGVLAYLVTQRTGEIGVRIALGARRSDVLGLILADGLRPALLGLFLGLVASAASVRLIASMLYGTQPFDVPVFAAVILTLLSMAALACLMPAWRASHLDPVRALRNE